ncbi:MAG: hypothetical protein AAGD38_16825 [Acidobacteriota bacterium]
MSTTCTFTYTPANTSATVVYEGTGDSAQLISYSIDGGDPKYPNSTPDMSLSALVSPSGELQSASAFTSDGVEAFACAVGGGPGGNNYQYTDTNGNGVSNDNCDLGCS